MKPSKFNVFFNYNNKDYITNTLSKSVDELEGDDKQLLETGDFSKLSSDEQEYLLSRGFAVKDEIDEIGLLRYNANRSKDSKEEMEFVIAPTLACNFKCIYCFESPRKGSMNESTQNAVLSFIFKRTNTDENKRVHIIWFGGEPLLYPNIIIRMNQKIYDFCKENNKECKSDIITNGYLLNRELVKSLETAHISHFQITLDGIKEIHDSRRMLCNGGGTYDAIYTNLKLFKDSNITVSLRINVDKSNISTFNNLEQDITNLNNPNIKCSPALVEVSSKHIDDEVSRNCFTDHNGIDCYYTNECISKYYKSYSISDYPLREFYCEAEHHHSFAIDELGNVYKCWNSLGVEKDILCTVYNEEYNPAVLSTFFSRDPFTENDCKNCPYIPICAGGCLMQKILQNRHFCDECKYTFLKAAMREIDSKNKRR